MREYTRSFLLLAAGILTLGLGAGCKKSDSASLNGLKRYPYERLHVTYEYTGDVRGTEDLYVSGYGKYEARYSKLDLLAGQTIRSVDNAAITRIGETYSIDFTQNRGSHDHSSSIDSLYHLSESDIPSPQEYLESEMKKNFFKKVGTDIIAGKPATRWQQMDGDLIVWVWNSILLRKEINSAANTLDMTVKNIDSLWTVDTTKFAIPPGVTITQAVHTPNAPSPN
ncbi:MAG: hypothetical protein Q8916_08015 [Bacteroidota bacterium]|nr:hypothetical protein [Bacteroidota bacterium]MDP4230330.1 hypothetical protein [Bacteroidota bacterium]MDP4235229.1 hypothetical protein [Bacteroidota bacterium]